MNKSLGTIAQITTGYSFRGAVPQDEKGSCRAIQVKDIDENGFINMEQVVTVDADQISEKAILQQGDVLLSMRGTESTTLKIATYICETTTSIATSSLYVLRVTDSSVLPEYLQYYFQSIEGQRRLKGIMRGATVKTISKKELATFLLPIPSLDKQQLLARVRANITKQKVLLSRKTHLLESLADNIISIY